VAKLFKQQYKRAIPSDAKFIERDSERSLTLPTADKLVEYLGLELNPKR